MTAAICSHRGIREGGASPENTPAAFASTSATGVDWIELDTWRAADGGFLVQHDREVAGVGPIDMLSPGRASAGVPTLEEALAACAVSVVNVELKVPVELEADAARLLGNALADWLVAFPHGRALVVSSFSPDALVGVRERSSVPIGLLAEARPGPDELDEIAGRDWQAAHVHWSGWDLELLAECEARRLGLVVWTLNDDDGLRAALRAPLRAVITDRPLRALELRAELTIRAAR